MACPALAVGLVGAVSLIMTATGCSSTSSNPGAADGAAKTPTIGSDGESEVPVDAGSNGGECSEAGGQCLIGDVICAVPGPQTCGAPSPAGLFCCLSNVADCGQPDATTYACPDQPAAGSSCQSAPIPIGAPNYQALTEAEDKDASYPAGCKVTFAACNGGKVPYCTCSGSAPGFSGWSCFF
jgi:hypothetical protein